MGVLCLPLIDVFKKFLPDFGKPQDSEHSRGLEPLSCSYMILICFSGIGVDSILKDGNPQWREKTVFVRVSFMIMMMMMVIVMLKFLGKKFFMGKIRTTTFERKGLRDLQ